MTIDHAFVRDESVGLDNPDAFAHGNYARVLAGALAHAPAPFNVGLSGPCGVGKSTVIRALHGHLPPDCVTVDVDVWRYEGDALRRGLLRTVADGALEARFDLDDLAVRRDARLDDEVLG
jgi:ATPase subunit of ABC transporter with duplicated ATPase domains